ncbi:LegC family aminotransferase [Pontibacillus litoralis]|uniref:Aminotransferase DegT n=1 Tax=Pontibacillus litoralis JSM 072002 TaxID=1385512 RepID=A0A0A5FZP0_9BACI|nr:LegC family aminotransferase [Pontibacillus litoralis]KGX86301.1 aminotransferase DegT [Pontibacillus litoralis JSM 072002]
MAQKFIPLSVPNLKGRELEYVTNAVETEWVSTGGSYINKFEDSIASYLHLEQAVACQSGTAGLHLALKLSDVGPNDEVIVPSLTFIAAVNPVTYCGADPVFMDCDDTLNMDTDKLIRFVEQECKVDNGQLINRKTGKGIKAILVVHIFGNLLDMERVMNVAQKYNIKVIEDATESLGSYYTDGKYKGKYAGTVGDFGVYSFNGNKIITTGGGGMLVGANQNLMDKAKYLSTQAKDDGLYYTHNEVGYNYRMTNVQAAIGLAQLEQLEQFIAVKERNYYLYQEKIQDIPGLRLLEFNYSTRPNYWFYSLIVDGKAYGIKRDELITSLHNKGIQTRPIWGLIHQQKPYKNNQAYQIEKANYYVENVINIPCSSNLTEEQVDSVVNCLTSIQARSDHHG